MSFEKKLIVGFAAMGLMAGFGGGLVGALTGAFVMGTVALIGVWIMS